MKVSCNAVLDLLPLYIDKSCSEDSKQLIEEHLAECPECLRTCRDMSLDLGISERYPAAPLSASRISGDKNSADQSLSGQLSVSQSSADQSADDFTAKKAFKKLRMHFIGLTAAIVAAVLLLIPLLTLSVHRGKGEGVCFTNLDDIYRTSRFLKAVKNGEYEKAFIVQPAVLSVS